MARSDGALGAAPARVDERRLADFKADPRPLMLSAMALLIGTGGAIGSLFAQFFHLSAAERRTLLVAAALAAVCRRPPRWSASRPAAPRRC